MKRKLTLCAYMLCDNLTKIKDIELSNRSYQHCYARFGRATQSQFRFSYIIHDNIITIAPSRSEEQRASGALLGQTTYGNIHHGIRKFKNSHRNEK